MNKPDEILTSGKVLVTGGAGFIGSALIWALNRLGIESILVSDQLGHDEKWRNLVPLRFDDYLASDELLDRVVIDGHDVEDVKLVFHLGACSTTTEEDVGYLMENNYRYSVTLCEWALRRKARFVYASSAATYGDGSHGMLDDPTQLKSLRPLNPYGYSKHLFDLHAARRGWLSRIVGLKYFNVYGPNESHKGDMRSLVNKAFAQVLDSGKIKLFKSYKPEYKDGEQKRDFLYVKDAIEMTIHLATSQAANGLFNLGSGQARTWIDLANAVFSALSRPPQIEFIAMPAAMQSKYQYFTQANVDRLQNTGYEGPRFTLEEGVKDYVQNYLVPGETLSP